MLLSFIASLTRLEVFRPRPWTLINRTSLGTLNASKYRFLGLLAFTNNQKALNKLTISNSTFLRTVPSPLSIFGFIIPLFFGNHPPLFQRRTDIVQEWDRAVFAAQVVLLIGNIIARFELHQRIEMRGSIVILFSEPNLVTAKEIAVEQVGFMGGENQLGAALGLFDGS